MATINDLVTATTDLLAAVNVSKSSLDSAVAAVNTVAQGLTSSSQSATKVLTSAEVISTQIDNIGQSDICTLQLPTCVGGMHFMAVVGENSTFNWQFRAASTDKFICNGASYSLNGYLSIPTPIVGSYVSVVAIKTAADKYNWMVTIGNGNWVIS